MLSAVSTRPSFPGVSSSGTWTSGDPDLQQPLCCAEPRPALRTGPGPRHDTEAGPVVRYESATAKWLLESVPGLAGSRRLAADCRLGGEQVSKHARSACPSPSPVSYQVGGVLASVPSGPAWADGGLVRMAGLEKQRGHTTGGRMRSAPPADASCAWHRHRCALAPVVSNGPRATDCMVTQGMRWWTELDSVIQNIVTDGDTRTHCSCENKTRHTYKGSSMVTVKTAWGLPPKVSVTQLQKRLERARACKTRWHQTVRRVTCWCVT